MGIIKKSAKFMVFVWTLVLGIGLGICLASIGNYLVKVGTVDGVPITRAEINDYIDTRMNGLVLDYVEDRIHFDALSQLGISVKKAEIQDEFDRAVEDNGGLEAFAEKLELAGTSLEQYKYNIHKVILSKKATEYFTKKASVNDLEITEYLNKSKESGKEYILMDCKSVELIEGETADSIDFSKIDSKRIIEDKNIQTSTVFDEVPAKGETTVSVKNGKNIIVKVEEVYRGNDNKNVREYVKELLKLEKGNADYQAYISDKVDNAKIMLK